jgi:hypothetical protein
MPGANDAPSYHRARIIRGLKKKAAGYPPGHPLRDLSPVCLDCSLWVLQYAVYLAGIIKDQAADSGKGDLAVTAKSVQCTRRDFQHLSDFVGFEPAFRRFAQVALQHHLNVHHQFYPEFLQVVQSD